ncbi:hypothetical protein [Paenibacillus graminis]|uniref:hypothetical protein n=1 Tax=Paenibacillus graminis TaxID=189425 RepID=UPI002DB5EBEB|nr:hypothetical protein [Paenibacillus graminis]MEC0169882.1 hypothetical protein [Paenibacillus graminis]
MIKDYAKFSATVAKGIKVGDTEVEIKLLLPLRVMQENFLFLSSNQGEKINVFMGDPQAAFDFGEEDEEVYREVTGRRVTTDASGVVTSVGDREGEDPNQASLFDQQEGANAESTDTGGEEGSLDQSEGAEQQEPGHTEGEHGNVGMEPEWLDGEGHSGSSDPEEGQGEPAPDGQTGEGTKDGSEEGQAFDPTGPADTDTEISREALDAFILANRPVYDDIEIDGTPILFPDLLKERIENDKTWKELALDRGVDPKVLSAKWGAYKKRVTRLMKNGGEAA